MNKRTAERADLKEEQGSPSKKTKIDELVDQLHTLQAQWRKIEQKRDAEIAVVEKKFNEQKEEIELQYKPRMAAFLEQEHEILVQKWREEALEKAREIMKAAKASPATVFLFDDRQWRACEYADDAMLLLDKELGGSIPYRGWWGLQTTEKHDGDWAYEDLEFEAATDNFWDVGLTHQVVIDGSLPKFYVDGIPTDMNLTIFSTKFVEDGVVWNQEQPNIKRQKEDIECNPSPSYRYTIYGRAWTVIGGFTANACNGKQLYFI
jgi:hypothetical protein